MDFGLLNLSSNDFKFIGYNDSDWDGNMNDRKSSIGFIFFMGDTIFFMSKKQSIVTLSTFKTEYVAVTSCICHVIWFENLLKELSLPQEDLIKI